MLLLYVIIEVLKITIQGKKKIGRNLGFAASSAAVAIVSSAHEWNTIMDRSFELMGNLFITLSNN